MDKLINPNVYIFKTVVKELTKKIVDSEYFFYISTWMNFIHLMSASLLIPNVIFT